MLSKLAIGAVLCGVAVATTAAGVLIYATLPKIKEEQHE